jgi:orotate phosphoribosyltransferase
MTRAMTETHTERRLHSGYLHSVLDMECLPLTIKLLEKMIVDSGLEFSTIAFRGMSGALIAPLIAHKLGKNLLMVRKTGDECHSSHSTEGTHSNENYIIIDDLISSGATVRKTIEAVNHMEECREAKCVGIFLYFDWASPYYFKTGAQKIPTWSFKCHKAQKFDNKYRIWALQGLDVHEDTCESDGSPSASSWERAIKHGAVNLTRSLSED